MPQIEIRADIGGSDGYPHTFIDIYNPDGTKESWGFGPAHGRLIDDGAVTFGWHESNNGSGLLDITDSQYTALMTYIHQTHANPPDYNPFTGSECTTWVMNGLREAGIMPGWSRFWPFRCTHLH